MDEAEIDDLDELTLLDYLTHGLFGFIIGIVIYCIYLLVVSSQSVEIQKGITVVWGKDISDVLVWGLLFPIGCAISGLFQARFVPLSYLRNREMLIFLIVGVLFINVIGYLVIENMSVTQVFEAPRSMHP
jgi:hypothetical protein